MRIGVGEDRVDRGLWPWRGWVAETGELEVREVSLAGEDECAARAATRPARRLATALSSSEVTMMRDTLLPRRRRPGAGEHTRRHPVDRAIRGPYAVASASGLGGAGSCGGCVHVPRRLTASSRSKCPAAPFGGRAETAVPVGAPCTTGRSTIVRRRGDRRLGRPVGVRDGHRDRVGPAMGVAVLAGDGEHVPPVLRDRARRRRAVAPVDRGRVIRACAPTWSGSWKLADGPRCPCTSTMHLTVNPCVPGDGRVGGRWRPLKVTCAVPCWVTPLTTRGADDLIGAGAAGVGERVRHVARRRLCCR